MTNGKMTPQKLAELYFEAWLENDVDRLASVIDERATFSGPLAKLEGREDVIGGLRGLASVTKRISIRKRLADESDVITWFTLDIEGTEGIEVSNWCVCQEGRISHINVTFDPREMLS